MASDTPSTTTAGSNWTGSAGQPKTNVWARAGPARPTTAPTTSVIATRSAAPRGFTRPSYPEGSGPAPGALLAGTLSVYPRDVSDRGVRSGASHAVGGQAACRRSPGGDPWLDGCPSS